MPLFDAATRQRRCCAADAAAYFFDAAFTMMRRLPPMLRESRDSCFRHGAYDAATPLP